MFITGNHSERGGGIGTNGSVVIGTEDNWKLNVTKIWNQVPESNYQDKEISIRLKIGDYEPVSYTHLDVYKRQTPPMVSTPKERGATSSNNSP